MLIRSSLPLVAALLPIGQAHRPADANASTSATGNMAGGSTGRHKHPSSALETVTVTQTMWVACPACPKAPFGNASTLPTQASPISNTTLLALPPASTPTLGGIGSVPVRVSAQTKGQSSSFETPMPNFGNSQSEMLSTVSETAISTDAEDQVTGVVATGMLPTTTAPISASDVTSSAANVVENVATSIPSSSSIAGAVIAASSASAMTASAGTGAATSLGLPTQATNAAGALMQGTRLAVAVGLMPIIFL